MPEARPAPFVWYELVTNDPRGAVAFYGEVLGWKTQPCASTLPSRVTWIGARGSMAGLRRIPEREARRGMPPQWLAYVAVEDVDATCALAASLGGEVRSAPNERELVGRSAVIADPEGALLGVCRPRRAAPPSETSAEGELCWSELVTAARDVTFYEHLFGSAAHRIGVTMLPEGSPMPTSWVHHVRTNDLTAAIARAKRRGAAVIAGPVDVPGVGDAVQCVDPQGAIFGLLASSN